MPTTVRAGSATSRQALPLTERDQADLELIRTSAIHQQAVERVTGVHVEGISQAKLLHAIFQAGLASIQEQTEADGYAQLAADRDAREYQTVARRRRPAWADEA